MRTALALVPLAAFALSGCAHTVVVSQSIADMDRARAAPGVQEGASLAPQEFEHAEQERALAREAQAHGDDAGADLYAERARVAYERAVILARLARATTAGEAARLSFAKQTDEVARLSAARAEFDRTADATASELAVAREATATAHIGPADPTRERARLLAARSLSAEGRLLCSAARLLVQGGAPSPAASDTARLDGAERDVAAIVGALVGWKPAPRSQVPLETAAAARAACLDALTHTRRVTGGASVGDADALLAALSARGGWAPSRDERGVVVTLRGAFKGTALVADAERQLKELGQVAASHAAFPLQVVVHDASPPTEAERVADAERGRVALAVLTSAGAASTSDVETIGTSLPVTDPTDVASRARNARLDIVFVSRTD